MKISVHAISIDILTHGLGCLQSVLDKGAAYAAAKKFDPSVLVTSRLAPDMLPLSKQVQIACDISKNSAARLAGMEPPRFEDNEKTFEELRVRIGKTLDYLRTITPAQLEGAEDRDIKVPSGEKTMEFKGLDFVQRWTLPNVFFHITTAYNILRHNGVDLGKRDFLGPM
jgi:uncharacterized protein